MATTLITRTSTAIGYAAVVLVLNVCTAVWSGGASSQAGQHPVSPAFVRATVESLTTVVQGEYFDPAVAARVGESLTDGLSQDRYSEAETLDALASLLTRDLFALTHDKHLVVEVIEGPSAESAGRSGEEEPRELRGRRRNFGVQRVEILPGNIGYLNVTAFYRPGEARDAIATAMATLQHADALILDMRDNGGGSPETVALLLSYVFDEPGLPLFEIIARSPTDGAQTYATETEPLFGQNGSRPVYVLSAGSTFSAGEGLAFLLQERGRSMVIGEQTAGAANPGRPYPLIDRLQVTVPNGQVRTALTGTNWEGVGVTPDVAVPASQALDVATVRALRELIGQAAAGSWREQLTQLLAAREDSLEP